MSLKTFALACGSVDGANWVIQTKIYPSGFFKNKGTFTLHSTEQSKVVRKKAYYRRLNNYGFERIGLKIPGCVDHHITKKFITSVPKYVHESCHHGGPTKKIEGVIG